MKTKHLFSAALLLLLALSATASAQSVRLRIDPKAYNYYLVDRHSKPIGGAVAEQRFLSGDQVYFYGDGEYHILRAVNDSAAVVHVIYANNNHYGFWTLKPQFQSITPVTPFNRFGLFIAFDGEAYSVWNNEGLIYVSPQYSSITCSPTGLLTLVSKYDGSVDTLHCETLLANGGMPRETIETDDRESAGIGIDTAHLDDSFEVVADSFECNAPDSGMIDPFIDEEPLFPGGIDALEKFLSDNLRYPHDAREKGISGTAFVKFMVEKDGSLTHVKVLRSPCKSIEEECLRLVSIMPRWIPAKMQGQLISTEYIIPIIFKP